MLISYVDPHTLPGRVLLPRAILEGALTRSSPGVRAMTDFSAETPVCVFPGRHIDDALQDITTAIGTAVSDSAPHTILARCKRLLGNAA